MLAQPNGPASLPSAGTACYLRMNSSWKLETKVACLDDLTPIAKLRRLAKMLSRNEGFKIFWQFARRHQWSLDAPGSVTGGLKTSDEM